LLSTSLIGAGKISPVTELDAANIKIALKAIRILSCVQEHLPARRQESKKYDKQLTFFVRLDGSYFAMIVSYFELYIDCKKLIVSLASFLRAYQWPISFLTTFLRFVMIASKPDYGYYG
jgi:hypothetical protein